MLVQMDTRGIVGAAFRQLRKFLLVFVPLLAMVVLYLLLAPRYYESNAVLLVKFGQDARPEVTIEGTPVSGLSAEERRGMVQSNLNILQSRDLAEALVKDMGVNRLYPDITDRITDETRRQNAAVRRMMDDIRANSHSDSGTLRVALKNEDPVIANEALRHFIDIFTRRQAEVFGNPQSGALADQAHQAYLRLEQTNRALTDFKVANSITSLDEELSLLLKQRGDLAGYLARRQDPSSSVTDPTTPGTVTDDYAASAARIGAAGEGGRFPVLEDIQRRIDEMSAREASLSQTYRPNSDVMRTLRRNIEAEQKNLADTVNALKAQIADLDRQIAQKQAHRSEYDNLTRAVRASEEAYKTAQDRLLAAQMNDDLSQRKITRISVIQQPIVPEKPAYPNKALVLLLGGLIAGMLGVALALLAELADQTFWRSEQLQAVLRLPVLGSFLRRAQGPGQYSRQELSSLYQSVASALPESGGKIICLSSCHEGEGAEDVAYALASHAAETLEISTLLVGQDSAGAGVSLLAVAQGRGQVAQAIHQHGRLAHAMLTASGETDAVMAGLPALQQVFAQLRGSYALVVIAAPRMTSVPALQALSRMTDGVIMVVEAERTRAPVVGQAVRQLVDGGSRVLGTVLGNRRLFIPGWLYSRL